MTMRVGDIGVQGSDTNSRHYGVGSICKILLLKTTMEVPKLAGRIRILELVC
jgi:hypothetical protein